MLRLILPHFERVIFTRFLNNPRSADLDSLLDLYQELRAENRDLECVEIEQAADPREAWRRALEYATPEHLVCVTGSFFIASEIEALRERQKT
jgi:folylpolyglutamate synthase/dihydropteroate synthase